MALDYFDGFDDYSYAKILRYWTTQLGNDSSKVSINATGGRNSGPGLEATPSGGGFSYYSKTLASQATRSVGFAIKASTFGGLSSGMVLFAFADAGTVQVDFRLKSDGTIVATRNGTTLGTTILALSATVYYHLQLKVLFHASAGTVDILVNGVNWLSLTGQNTKASSNATANQVQIGPSNDGNSGCVYDFDDFWSDDAGTLHGDCRVESKLPTGDGTTDNFTRSTGATNFSNVDDNPPNDDTDYNSTANAGDIDLYTFPALSTASGTVKAVMTVPVLRNDNAGSVTAASVYRSGGTNFFGTTNTVGSTTYAVYADIQATDPNTGSAWTVSNVNAAQFGLKRIA